jgi:ribosomal protein S18 acetylase RimI-like enzyme
VAVGRRPATADDREFLYSVYAATRTEELSVVPWTDEQKDAFLRTQFDAQDNYYHQAYADARFLVVTRDDEPIGRLYLARLDDELRIVDIALLPEHRRAGVGTRLISDVITEATEAGIAVGLHVEPWNPARRLYERLGFRTVETGQMYEKMELAAPNRRPARGQLNIAS